MHPRSALALLPQLARPEAPHLCLLASLLLCGGGCRPTAEEGHRDALVVPPPAPLALPAAARTLRYRIDARLWTHTRRLTGDLELALENVSRRPLHRLLFHLYLNAFSSDETLFMRRAGGRFRAQAVTPAGRGWIRVHRVSISNTRAETAVQASARRVADGTVLQVDLPAPLPVGERRLVRLRFDAQLPPIVARTGYAGEFFMLAQWYPKLGFLRADGSWHCPPFHPYSEFFARFADFDVTLTLPRRFRVGATGELVSATYQGRLARLRYRARAVHDVALAAWPHFTESRRERERFRLRLLTVPGRARQAEATLDLVESALNRLEAWLGRYPYAQLTIIDVPTIARRAMGMEYPMLFTTWHPAWAPPGIHAFAELTVHELTHQYFQGIVATNEAVEPWLDEGVTSFVSGIILDELFGRTRSFVDLAGLALGQWQKNALQQLERARPLPIARAAATFPSWNAYAATVYGRAASLLYTIDSLIGRRRMRAALRAYVRDQAFKHPGGDVLRRTLLAHSPPERREELRALLGATLDRSGRLDYRLSCKGGRVTLERAGEIALPLALYVSERRVGALGTVRARQVRRHDVPSRARHLEIAAPALEEAWLGPAARLALDGDPRNNRCSRRPALRALSAPLARLQQLYQLVLP